MRACTVAVYKWIGCQKTDHYLALSFALRHRHALGCVW